ncbi:MAG: hypothetical protein K8I29_16615 [Alphaproteobacteria bacterium]|uniref:Uncharacterized protein n=1 Tax=Candidatus Nitrobium versatile TaxID=2884831 RepID=A0A953M2M0_9BACT|nr:hypothetical protein [Candidatus Nitrobium versatile]
MVTSYVEGRVRVRDKALNRSSTITALKESLLKYKGIIKVTENRRVGSLLVIYDRAVTGIRKIMAIIAGYLNTSGTLNKVTASIKRSGKAFRRAINIGMLSALLASIVAAIVGSKGMHVIAGTGFLALFAMHFYRHKEMVFA